MEKIIDPIDKNILKSELSKERFIRVTRKGENEIYIVNQHNAPNVLQEIPARLEENFKIGETAKVKLGKNIIGVINTGMEEKGGRHSLSPLIDSEFEGSIRTENIRGLDHIELFLYRK